MKFFLVYKAYLGPATRFGTLVLRASVTVVNIKQENMPEVIYGVNQRLFI